MSRHTRSLTARRRDAGLRRLKLANRALIGGAVALTGLLADVAANAFPGHKRRIVPAAATVRPPVPVRAAGAHHRVRHHRHHALRRPAQAPSSAAPPQATTNAPAPAPATTAAPQPAPAVQQPAPAPASAPAPVVSGGS